MDIFEHLESNVRRYNHLFPTIFVSAQGAIIYDDEKREYIDFFSGAGALNYGHNNPQIKRSLLNYLENNGLVHGLDLQTKAKAEFMSAFESIILKPRNLDYKIQFTGPTGANAIEAALKISRLAEGKSNIIAFTNSFHGLSLGALAVTANSFYRNEKFVNRQNVSFLPYDGYLGDSINTIEYLEKTLRDPGSGVDIPAAVIVETVQAEGGINIAKTSWLRNLSRLCQDLGILLIIDDIQAGIGRAGTFFSFEEAGIYPDIVVLSKSLSGFGLPMSLVLLKPELDKWQSGEHSGTFRGNALAMVTAAASLQEFWQNDVLVKKVRQWSEIIYNQLDQMKHLFSKDITGARGKGMLFGLQLREPDKVKTIIHHCFQHGLLVEPCGPENNVIKLAPPLNIDEAILLKGLSLLNNAVQAVLGD